ncbi:uncharacterized protein LOC104882627 [Vitis vinifera]|uniref:uncharacterized protein LOC104882627 n=1 Tax=Vitis vinifera TaxID=29760 RepID=UPI0008FEB622|nr:uncharacterized protein LOC104882627 [Vitis vinifera]|eukprot:XP_010664985.2 PREDICTED: uncharacterized protein LOC104882627 [Vitis vinifera]
MKEEQQHLHHQQRKIITAKKLTRPTAYVLLLLLSYVLGYLSAPSSSSVHSPTAGTASIPTTAGAAVAESDIGHFGVTRRCGDPVPSKLVRQTILDRVFNGTSPFYSFPPPHVAHLLRPKRIKWWGSNGAVFENLIRRVKPRTIIDVGTFLGASAIHMARLGPARHAF